MNIKILTFFYAVYLCLTRMSKHSYSMIIYPKSINQPVFILGIFSVYCMRNETRGTFVCKTVISSRVVTRTSLRVDLRVISSGQNDPETGFCPSTASFPISVTVHVPVSGKADKFGNLQIQHCCLEHWRALKRKVLCVVFFRCFKD